MSCHPGLLIAAALLGAVPAFAAPITVGSMFRADGSELIVDSLNDRQWLGWDVTRGLTYNETVAQTQAGGVFEGFAIARNADALLFLNALLGASHGCSDPAVTVCFTDESPQREHLVGESYFSRSNWAFDDFDYVFYLSDNNIGEAAGALEVQTGDGNRSDSVSNYNEWGTFAATEAYAGVPQSIGWLLYRQPSMSVPEPGSAALAGVALLAVLGTRRRATKWSR